MASEWETLVLGAAIGGLFALLGSMLMLWTQRAHDLQDAELEALRELVIESGRTVVEVKLASLREGGVSLPGPEFTPWLSHAHQAVLRLRGEQREVFEAELRHLFRWSLGEVEARPVVDPTTGEVRVMMQAAMQRVFNLIGIAEATLLYLETSWWKRRRMEKPWLRFTALEPSDQRDA